MIEGTECPRVENGSDERKTVAAVAGEQLAIICENDELPKHRASELWGDTGSDERQDRSAPPKLQRKDFRLEPCVQVSVVGPQIDPELLAAGLFHRERELDPLCDPLDRIGDSHEAILLFGVHHGKDRLETCAEQIVLGSELSIERLCGDSKVAGQVCHHDTPDADTLHGFDKRRQDPLTDRRWRPVGVGTDDSHKIQTGANGTAKIDRRSGRQYFHLKNDSARGNDLLQFVS